MKRILGLFLAAAMCLSLCACGQSKAAKTVEEAIEAIGEVSIDSNETIANATKLYDILTDSEKSEIPLETRLALLDAQAEFEHLRGEVVYKNAKEAYEKLKEVESLCVTGMDAIYGAWYFGIYEADDGYSFYSMAADVPGISGDELEAAASTLGLSYSSVERDWQNALYIVEQVLTTRGDYDTISKNMTEAEKILQSLTEEYDDYTYYPKLKDYFAAVAAYVEFYKAPSGSFQQLKDTINNYENGIRTLSSDVGFLFTK